MKITVSKFYKMNQPGTTTNDSIESICPSYLVELSVVTSSGQEGVGEDIKNFAEQLKPLVMLEKTDHRKIQLAQI
ncbi:mediator of RNA polymerase II transcription subunit 18-like [Saccostrea cucullata]